MNEKNGKKIGTKNVLMRRLFKSIGRHEMTDVKANPGGGGYFLSLRFQMHSVIYFNVQ